MPANGWAHDVPGDPVHFDHTASADDRGRDVIAFQHLWNLNNPSDHIAEDGDYGPQTQARLMKSPATGFATGPDCAVSAHVANTVSVDGPDHVMSGATAHYAFTLVNSSQTDWSDTTAVVVASGKASQLFDSDSWSSPTQLGTLGQTVAAGEMVTFEFDVRAPVVSAELPIAEPLQLTDNGVQVGQMNLGVIVTMSPDDDSSEGSDPTPSGTTTGGCSTSGGGAGLLAALGLVGVRRRRRR